MDNKHLSQVPEVDEDGDIVKVTTEQKVWKYIGAESTLFIVVLLFAYLCIFGAILQAVEADEEIKLNVEWRDLIGRIQQNISAEDYASLLTFVERDDVRGTEGFVTYDEATGEWIKGDALAFFSSVSYCFNLVSTIGYGDIIVQTDEGKILSIFCILIGFPIGVAAYTRFAEWAFSIISTPVNRYLWRNNKMVNLVLTKFDKNHDGELDIQELSQFFATMGAEVSHEEVEMVIKNIEGPDMYNGKISVGDFMKIAKDPVLAGQVGLLGRETYKLPFSAGLLVGFVIVHTLIAEFVFDINEHATDSIYFTIVTMTTVGLGDIVPAAGFRLGASALAFVGVGFTLMFLQEVARRLQATTDFQKRNMRRAIRRLATKDPSELGHE